jgi:hypothetical protein
MRGAELDGYASTVEHRERVLEAHAKAPNYFRLTLMFLYVLVLREMCVPESATEIANPPSTFGDLRDLYLPVPESACSSSAFAINSLIA